MPTFFILNGYRFIFYSDDNQPVHVHVEKDGHTAKLNVEPVELIFNKGYKVNEINEIESIVNERKDLIIEKRIRFLRTNDMKKKHVLRVWVDDGNVFVQTVDGLTVKTPFSKWSRLANATKSERENFQLSYLGIYWPDLDEDLSFEGLFAEEGLCDFTAREDSVVYEKTLR